MVHVVVAGIAIDLVVVLISLLLEEALVAVGIVAGSWRQTLESLVTLLLTITGLKLLLSVLVKSKEGKDKDLVVGEGAEDEQDKAEDGLPVEVLKTERATHDPDDERARGVDCGTLSS